MKYAMKEAGNLFASLIVNCIFNSFLSYAATMLNVVIILALWRTSSLPKTLKALILSLAVSDLGVGLVVQPMYVAHLLMEMQNTDDGETYCDLRKALLVTGRTLTYASFFGVTALSIDRFLAIHIYLKYQELLTYQRIVTYKRVVVVVILSWLLSALSIIVVVFSQNVGHITIATVGMVCFVTMGLMYFKFYLVVRRHTTQVHAQTGEVVTPNEENRSNFARLRKTAVGTFYVYLLFLACHLPITVDLLASMKNGQSRIGKHLLFYTRTLLYLNASLDPLIYCWKIRQIRCAVKDILRDMFAN